MVQYIYFVKCPDCEDEHFDFFDEAKEFAMSCLTKKPIITQIEVDRNDFGECVDSCDLGTVWSWEEVMKDVPAEPEATVFSKTDTFGCVDCDTYSNDNCVAEDDPEFAALDNSLDFVSDDFRKPVPADKTIESLVEEMEENEDEVECKWCGELFGKDECRYEVDLGYLCGRCEAAIKSRGETLTFREELDLEEDMELNEASLSDIAAAANSEFGTFYDDNYLLDAAGVDDDLRYVRNDSTRTHMNTSSKIVDERAYIKKDAKKYSEAGRADLYNKKYAYFIRHFEDTPALDPETNELVYDEVKKKEIVDLVYATRYAAMEKSREAVKRAREKATMKKKALEATMCEDITSERSFEELVKDSISHLVNDLGKDPCADNFADDVIKDLENNYDLEIPEDMAKYNDWASSVACEVSKHVSNFDNLTEGFSWIKAGDRFILDTGAENEHYIVCTTYDKDYEKHLGKYERFIQVAKETLDGTFENPIDIEYAVLADYKKRGKLMFESKSFSDGAADDHKAIYDLGNEYDGGYPTNEYEAPEIEEVSEFHLALCPECGDETFDHETGVCINCGFH